MHTAPEQMMPINSMPTPALRWLELYGDSLFAYALHRVRRRETAEDLLQETLLAAVQAWNQFSHQSNINTWLVGILRHKISDHLRARYRNEKIETSALDDDQMFNPNGTWKHPVSRWNSDPHHLAESSELKAVITGCMAKLPTRMAYIFVSRATDEISTADLCVELEITPENAWALLHRARLRLRHCLNSGWFSNDVPATK